MESVTMKVPALWADHHTLVVRDLLTKMDGVSEVVASSKNREVTFSHAPGVDLAAVESALASAGYPTGEEKKPGETGFVWRKAREWAAVADRVTTTNMVDLQMSGDHRKY